MTDAGMFDVIIDKLMKCVGDNVIGVTVMTAVIALIGHLDGGGASTFLIVVPSMLPVYKKMHMRPTTLLRVAVLAMGVLNLMPWAVRPCVQHPYSVWSRTALERSDPDPDLWNPSLSGACGVCRCSGEKERRRSERKACNGSSF